MSTTHCSGDNNDKNDNFFTKHKHFPKIIDGKIKTQDFIESVIGIVTLIDSLGTVFAPVKYDMNGNINKIMKCYEADKVKNSTLHDLVLTEISQGTNTGTDALLWLTRALYFIETFLYKIIEKASENIFDTIKNELTYAYELTLKKYHNWMTQKIFKLICGMCPTKSQLYKSMDMSDMKIFVQDANSYLEGLRLNRTEIDNFYKINKLCDENIA